jgi:hypothetical protein
MGIPKIDGRKVWLDEGQIHANNFLSKMMEMQDKRTLSKAEKNLKQVSASFLYLYNKCQEAGLFDNEDELFEFFNETIH